MVFPTVSPYDRFINVWLMLVSQYILITSNIDVSLVKPWCYDLERAGLLGHRRGGHRTVLLDTVQHLEDSVSLPEEAGERQKVRHHTTGGSFVHLRNICNVL